MNQRIPVNRPDRLPGIRQDDIAAASSDAPQVCRLRRADQRVWRDRPRSSPDRGLRGDVVLMRSGCICCTIRGDLSEAIRGLYAQRERGDVTFARLVIETTGLADPTPILATIMHEPQIRHHFQLASVITTVDAVNGALISGGSRSR